MAAEFYQARTARHDLLRVGLRSVSKLHLLVFKEVQEALSKAVLAVESAIAERDADRRELVADNRMEDVFKLRW